MRSRVGALFKERVEEIILKKAGDIATGFCQTYELYKEHCGVIQGLQVALEIMDEIEGKE